MAAVTEDHAAQAKRLKSKARTSLALLVVAAISITTATYAWFSLSNSTSVQSMIVEVGTGTTLKAYAGTTTSTTLASYFGLIKSEGTTGSLAPGEIITDALPQVAGVNITSLSQIKLWPVTSGNGVKLYTESGNVGSATVGPEKMYFLQLTLTFLSDTDMDVYLNGDNSSATVDDKTQVTANTAGSQADENAVKALRISFEDTAAETSLIYEPGYDGAATTLHGAAKTDAKGDRQPTFTYLGDNSGRHKDASNESPALFSLKANTPKVIVIRMWVEGEDAQCVNNSSVNIERAKVNVRLRFSAAGTDGNFMETAPR